MQDNVTHVPWHRIPAFWLMIGIPTATVIGCLFTIYLAVSNPDPVLQRTPTTAVQTD
ncbi:MAG: hypothetical protein AAFO81_00575 [Pseudomonadota bacterium]